MAEPTSSFARMLQVIRCGTDTPSPARQMVRAGALVAILEEGSLRYVAVQGREIVRRIYVAVRNRNWETIPAHVTAYEVDGGDDWFEVRLTATHDDGDVGFAWDGRIAGSSDGVITCTMDGEVRRDFLKNRIGFCVLHPVELAGQPVEVEHPDGFEAGRFPERIAPHQPFVDMVAITYPVPVDSGGDGKVTLRFEGDLFEMEDQRNWTDASFKTYSTPLRLPYPVRVEAGQRITQSVTLRVTGVPHDTGSTTGHPLTVRIGRPLPRSPQETGPAARPPAVLPPIGLGMATHDQPLTGSEVERLRALRPAHLRVPLDLSSGGWEHRLRRGAEEAAALGCALELEVVAGDHGEGLDRLVPMLAAGIPVERMLVFPRSGWVTTEPVLRRAGELLGQAGLRLTIGGGSRADFAELNRAELPLRMMDIVGYTITPQVHAFDDASLVENLAVQATTVACARTIATGRPLTVGPITLRPRFNPNVTGPEPAPRSDRLPLSVDPRQLSLFGAGWTIGSLRYLAEAGASALTYYETTGWQGVMQGDHEPALPDLFPARPGMVFPLYHVFADVADFVGSELLMVSTSEPLRVEGLALHADSRLLVLIASLTDEPQRARLELPALTTGTIRVLDETTAHQAMTDPAGFREHRTVQIEPGSTQLDLDLAPFAVVCIEGSLLTADA